MTLVEEFSETNNYNHWDSPALSGYIYKDVLSANVLKNLQKEISNIVEVSNTGTFLTNTAIFNFEGKKYRLGSNVYNDRYQNVIFDFSYHPEYWYQTKDTIYDWIFNLIKNNCSPNFVRYFYSMVNNKPFETKKYIPYRCHINNSPTNKLLGYHLDGHFVLIDGDYYKSRQYSVTYYLYDHKENTGGEFFSINGFVYKPQQNSAIAINGHQVLHAVTENLSYDTRLAFTTRWIHIDDLFLPGHPDKHFWNVKIDV